MPLDENKTTGYIRVYRSLKKHWLWHDANRLKWWLTILMEVNHTDKKILIQGTLIDCLRGQSLNSIETWSKLFRCSIQQVRTFFSLLKKDGMIELEGMQKTTRLTVCNYDNYNKTQQADNEQIPNQQRADNGQITTNNNDNNLKNEKNENLVSSLEKDFFNTWEKWKKFKKKRFDFVYKHAREQEALDELNKISGGNFQTAIAIIEKSILNEWFKLYALNSEVKKEQMETPVIQMQLLRPQIEINELYKKFVEDETHVTIISTDVTQYNFLKREGRIAFSEKQLNKIRKMATKECNGDCTDTKIENMIKKIGVIEFFKQQKAKGSETIFQVHQDKLIATN